MGEEPDARFSLANERTYLAWTRTSLALFGAGVALEALDVPIEPVPRVIAAIALIGLGLLAGWEAWFGWVRTERAMRDGTALPGPVIAPYLTVGIAMVMVLVAVGLLW